MGLLARISKAFGRKGEDTPPSRALAPVVPQLPLYQQYQRVGGHLTPLQVSAIIQSADTGSQSMLVDLGNDFRQKDSHLQSLLGTREGALAGLPWVVDPAVVPGAAQATDQDRAVADFVDNCLRLAEGRGQESRSFTDTVSHLAGGIYFGHATTETEWDRNGTNLVPVGFRPISQRRFVFDQDDGRLKWYDGYGPKQDAIDLTVRYPDKFITHQPRVNGDVPAREGLVRVLMWATLFRNWTLADWMKLAELSWKPWRFGTYKGTANDEDITALVEAMERLTTNGFATHSDQCDIKVEWPMQGRGSRSGHGELCEFLAQEMSKCVLGQTLTVQQGERGARSLGEVHDRVRKDIAEADSVAMAATIRRDLIAPIVRLNFGAEALIPAFHFITEDVPDLGGLARGVEGLVRAGLRIPATWVRDKIGMPEPVEGDEILTPQTTSQPAQDDRPPEPEPTPGVQGPEPPGS